MSDQAFPFSSSPDPDHYTMSPDKGMTYRQWLVGRILTGAILRESLSYQPLVTTAMKIADMAIEEIRKCEE